MEILKILIGEHNLISRMRDLMDYELNRIQEHATIDTDFIIKSVDFIKTYADKCHHGKEENILFKELKEKNLKEDDRKDLQELIEEHIYERNLVSSLINAEEEYARGFITGVEEITKYLEKLIAFFPIHIKHEEDDFFIRSMDYFSKDDRKKLLGKFYKYDRKLIHEKYRKITDDLELRQS